MDNIGFTFELVADVFLVAEEVPSQRILKMAVTAPRASKDQARPVLNLGLVVDRSGSMHGEKLEYVKQAAIHVMDLLQEQDRLALVTFDDEVEVVSPSVAINPQSRAEIKRKIIEIQSGGSTNLSGGWLLGCQQVAEASAEKQLQRVLLLTDGLANAGITDMEELGKHAHQLQNRGISTSTFGVGEGFNEHLLEYMANQGGGNFHYIDNPRSIPAIFIRELQEMASVTARNVEIALGVPAQIDVQVLGGWKQEIRQGKLVISVGDLASNQKREVFIKLLVPPAGNLKEVRITAEALAKGEDDKTLTQPAELVLHYAPKSQVQVTAPRIEVLEQYSGVAVAEAATEALKLERKGQTEEAGVLLENSLRENAAYMPAPMADQYQSMAERLRRGMSEYDRKTSHQASYNQRQRRDH